MIPTLFLKDTEIAGGLITVGGDKAYYLKTVLRTRPGAKIVIKDGQGKTFNGVVRSIDLHSITVEITDSPAVSSESTLHTTLIQGLLKGEKMDLVIRIATELGVNEIVPVVTERSQVRHTRRLDRWTKIAEEAARQSGRNVIPQIHEVSGLHSIFEAAPSDESARILFWERGGAPLNSLIKRLKGVRRVAVLTGPEGGFSEDEVRLAEEKGFSVATLGCRILRAETAAIATVSIIQFGLGDLGENSDPGSV